MPSVSSKNKSLLHPCNRVYAPKGCDHVAIHGLIDGNENISHTKNNTNIVVATNTIKKSPPSASAPTKQPQAQQQQQNQVSKAVATAAVEEHSVTIEGNASSPLQGPSSTTSSNAAALDKDSCDSSVQVKVAQNIIKERTLLHRVRGIFAKVSRENFNEVKDELCALPIHQSKDEEVREIAHWIYYKAVQPEDEIFAELYANLIKKFTSDIKNKDAKKSSALRKALVDRCQQFFDKRTDVNKASADKISGEADAETTVQTCDSAASAALKESIAKDEDADYVKNCERSRLRSNIKFLALLFRVQMVNVRAVNCVLYTLLYGSQGAKRHKLEEYEIEMFCDLIKNTQELLPPHVRTSYLPNYMATVKDVSQNSKTSPRVKFLLMDLLELYEHNWEDRETRRKKGQLGSGAGSHGQTNKSTSKQRQIRFV